MKRSGAGAKERWRTGLGVPGTLSLLPLQCQDFARSERATPSVAQAAVPREAHSPALTPL